MNDINKEKREAGEEEIKAAIKEIMEGWPSITTAVNKVYELLQAKISVLKISECVLQAKLSEQAQEIEQLQEIKNDALPYLEDLLTIKKMFGDHSYASHLQLLIMRIKGEDKPKC